MRLVTGFLCAALLLMMGVSPELTQAHGTEGLSCSLSTSKKVFSSGKAIVLNVTVQNPSDKGIYFINYTPYGAPWGSAVPRIVDSKGKEVEFTWPVPAVHPGLPDTVEAVRIPPRSAWKNEIQLYSGSMSRSLEPGNYRITIHFNPPPLSSFDNKAIEQACARGDLRPPRGLEELKKMPVTFYSGQIVSNTIDLKVTK